MRVVRLIAIAALTAAALLLAAMGLMLITDALSGEASEVEAGPLVTVAVGGLFIAVALMAAWLARAAQRGRSGRRDGAA
jgi:hypothetical protein